MKKAKCQNAAKRIWNNTVDKLIDILAHDGLDLKNFQKDCKVTLRLIDQVESWLEGWAIPSIVPIVNSMNINLKMPEHVSKLNSCLLIAPRGTGKSELLERILWRSNPTHFTLLDSKIFESELVAKGKEYFHNKVLVHPDILTAFQGLTPKQRQQLNYLWTGALEGNYSRERYHLEGISTMVLFGMAKEQYALFRGELLSATFFDRVPAYVHNVDMQMKSSLMKFKDDRDERNPKIKRPLIVLPLPKDRIEDKAKVAVSFPHDEEMNAKIRAYALELDMYEVQSASRAQDYIKVFVMCNALLNGRRTVSKSDLTLYALVHPLFISSGRNLSVERLVLSTIKANPDLSDMELIEKSGIAKRTFYRYKKILRMKSLI